MAGDMAGSLRTYPDLSIPEGPGILLRRIHPGVDSVSGGHINPAVTIAVPAVRPKGREEFHGILFLAYRRDDPPGLKGFTKSSIFVRRNKQHGRVNAVL
jgi:hypothetical protein